MQHMVAPLRRSPFRVRVHAATSMNATATRVTSPFIDDGPQVASTAALLFTTFDYDGNQREAPATNFSVALALNATPLASDASYIARGVYAVETQLTRAGAFALDIAVNGYAIVGSPFNIVVEPNEATASGTFIVDASGLNASLTDQTTQFFVQARPLKRFIITTL